jgi:hypothetical protein
MSQLNSVVLGDAGWIAALLIGLIIESRLSKTIRRHREAGENYNHGWLAAPTCSRLTRDAESSLLNEGRKFT